MKIVEYDSSFLEDITELYNLWDDIPDLTPREMEKTVEAYESHTDNKTFIALNDEGKAVGYVFCGVCCFLGVEPFLEIIQIMFREEYRGQGFGKEIMEFVTDLYQRQGIKQIRLHSRVKLTKAHAFYERMGFKEFKQSKFFIKNI